MNDAAETDGKPPPPRKSDRYDIAGAAIGREIAVWLREFHGRGNLIPVPEGIQQAAKGLACQFAVVGFMKTAPERTIRLATQVIPVVQSTSTSPPDEPLVLPDSRSATSRALLLGLEQIFLGRDLHPHDPDEAVASALKSLREAIPYDKLPRAFREPTTDQLRQAADVMRLHITLGKAGGRGGKTVTPRGAAERFAAVFGLKSPKSW